MWPKTKHVQEFIGTLIMQFQKVSSSSFAFTQKKTKPHDDQYLAEPQVKSRGILQLLIISYLLCNCNDIHL